MLLINPAQEKFGGFLSRYIPVGIPVAIGCIAAYLKKHGIAVNVVDDEITDITPSVLREKVQGLEKPHIFGLSCLTAHVVRGYSLSRMIKSEFPDSIVVVGGLHPTALPDEALALDTIDYVVRGEGEETMLKLYRAIRGGENVATIKGLSYKCEGKIVHNPEAPLIPDLDDIPIFPYELFRHPKYDMGFICTSRGCPYKCTYCSQRMLTGTTYRYKSAERIVQELDVLINEFGQKQIVFQDDNFCFKKKRVIEVCEQMIGAGFHKKCAFSIQTRADNFQAEFVPIMAAAGFKHVGFGMETGVNRLASLIGKGETVEQHIEATKVAKQHGMSVSLFMIFGLPTETDEDRETSYRVVQSMKVQASKYNNLIPYPGTPIYTDLGKTDRVHILPGWSNFNSTLSVTRSIFDRTPLPYVPETTSEWQLKRDIIKYNLKTYLKKEAFLSILTGKEGPGWYRLPERWYLKPVELFHVSKIGVNVLINMLMSYLPLAMTEPFMTWLNPVMKRRPRVAERVPEFKGSQWSAETARAKTELLKQAKSEREKGRQRVALPILNGGEPMLDLEESGKASR